MPDNQSRVELDGVEEAFRDFDRWADQLGPAVQSDAAGFGGRLVSRVSGRVPKLTGVLAASVGWDTLPGDDHGGELSMGGGLPYAGWIEFGGSRGRPAVPEGRYLWPTATAATDEFATLAESTAEQTIRGFPWNKT